jgi:hypothetical protein
VEDFREMVLRRLTSDKFLFAYCEGRSKRPGIIEQNMTASMLLNLAERLERMAIHEKDKKTGYLKWKESGDRGFKGGERNAE